MAVLEHRWALPLVCGALAYGLESFVSAGQPQAILLGLGLMATIRIIHAEVAHLRRKQ